MCKWVNIEMCKCVNIEMCKCVKHSPTNSSSSTKNHATSKKVLKGRCGAKSYYTKNIKIFKK